MTIGKLSRRTGVPVKLLREYTDMRLIYTVGRSDGNYRLFDEEALVCIGVIGMLRGAGLTLAEIRDLAEIYLGQTGTPIGPRLARVLTEVRARTETRISQLQQLLIRIDDYEAKYSAELTGRGDFRAQDPRSKKPLDSSPGGRP